MCVLMCVIACVILRVHFSDNGMLIIAVSMSVCARVEECVRVYVREGEGEGVYACFSDNSVLIVVVSMSVCAYAKECV